MHAILKTIFCVDKFDDHWYNNSNITCILDLFEEKDHIEEGKDAIIGKEIKCLQYHRQFNSVCQHLCY